LALLEPARDLKVRHASILLTFNAVVDALAKADARKEQAGMGFGI
jgi:NifU-like protein involved in Fe-S cluster formation